MFSQLSSQLADIIKHRKLVQHRHRQQFRGSGSRKPSGRAIIDAGVSEYHQPTKGAGLADLASTHYCWRCHVLLWGGRAATVFGEKERKRKVFEHHGSSTRVLLSVVRCDWLSLSTCLRKGRFGDSPSLDGCDVASLRRVGMSVLRYLLVISREMWSRVFR